MAKEKTLQSRKKTEQSFLNTFSIDNYISKKFQPILGILLILILFFIFYSPILFQGKICNSGDITTGHSYQTFKDTYKGNALWNPYIFCGMPSQVSGVGYSHWFDFINVAYADIRQFIGNLFNNQYAENLVFMFVLALTTFFFLRSKKADVLIATFSAIAASFSTGLVLFIFIGHITKLYTLSMFPLVFLILERFREKIKLLDFIILTIAVSFMLSGWHIQVILYTLISITFYFVFFFFASFRDKVQRNQIFKSASLTVGAFLIAFLLSSDMYMQIYEYSKYSTRGSKGVLENSASTSDTKSTSDFYNYNTMWSFSPGEVMTFVIPSYYGYGNNIYKGELTKDKEVQVNTYFGQMESVDVPMYMGVIVLFFGIFGFFANRKDRFVIFLGILGIFALLMSFGKNFPLIFNIFYYYFPKYDNFRGPSMILVLLQLCMPLLAGMGILKLSKSEKIDKTRYEKFFKLCAIIFSAIFILSIVLNSVIKDGLISRIGESARSDLSQIAEFISEQYFTDILIAFALLAACSWLSYFYVKEKISKDILTVSLLVLLIFDLLRVDAKGAVYIDKNEVQVDERKPAYIETILNQNDKEPFRILNLKQGVFGSVGNNANYNMRFLLQDLYGYSGIKPRPIQDYVDVQALTSPSFWRMLNVKYIIADQFIPLPQFKQISADTTNHNFVYEFQNALPRLYFVDSVIVNNQALAIVNSVKDQSFDAKKVAFVEKDIKVDKPDSNNAYVKLTHYSTDIISAEVNATGNNFLFFGDTYYPKGWIAKIDNNETEILRANWGFRGILIPKGKHQVTFQFEPKSYEIGKTLSLTFNVILIIGLAFGIVWEIRNRKKKSAELS